MAGESESDISPETLREIFYREIAPDIDALAIPQSPNAHASPIALFIVGQPGSGKSTIKDRLCEVLGLDGWAEVDADQFRLHYPGYTELLRQEPFEAATKAHPAAATWMDMAIAHAAQKRYDTLIMGTFRNVEWSIPQIEPFWTAGYEVAIAYLAAHESWSRFRIIDRYLGEVADGDAYARYVPQGYHDGSCAGLVATAAALDDPQRLLGDVAVRVYAPDGAEQAAYFNRFTSGTWVSDADTVSAIESERVRHWNRTIEDTKLVASRLLEAQDSSDFCGSDIGKAAATLLPHVCLRIEADCLDDQA